MLLTAYTLAFLWGAAPLVEVQPGELHPGDLVALRVAADDPSQASGRLGDTIVAAASGKHAEYFFAVPTDAQPAVPVGWEVAVTWNGTSTALAGELPVLSADFPVRELQVARKFVRPTRQQKRWSAADQKAFDAAFSQPMTSRSFSGAFIWPLRNEVTAPFGDQRNYNGVRQSQHQGIDIDGRKGEPIVAAHTGRVVMTRACFASGNTIVIHHGANLYSAYFHLSKIFVRNGALVRQGERIGAVGSTGRVTGPHLHWGIRVGPRWANPQSVFAIAWR